MKKYYLDNEREELYDLDSLLDYIFSSDDSYYDEYEVDDEIDECYGTFEIAGRTFYASEILRDCDDCLYDEVRDDIIQNTIENDRDYYYTDIADLEKDETLDVNGYVIHVLDDEYGDAEEEEEYVTPSFMRDVGFAPFTADEPEACPQHNNTYIFSDSDLEEISGMI